MANRESLNQFLQSVERSGYRMAWLATSNQSDALDLVQDAMIKLATNYAEKSSDDWRPLFYRILQNRIVDWHRKQKVRNLFLPFRDNRSEGEEGGSGADYFAGESINEPEQQIDSAQRSERLDRALKQLPLRQRQAFLLRIGQGMNVAETALAMDCSEGSVKTHLSRANAALTARLKPDID